MDKLLTEESGSQSRYDEQRAFSRELVAQRLKHQLIEQQEEEDTEKSSYSKPLCAGEAHGQRLLAK